MFMCGVVALDRQFAFDAHVSLSQSSVDLSAGSSGSQSSAQTGLLPAGLPIGPSAAALAAARSEAQAHQNVYESLGRPPAIRYGF